jgi:hypothetical protein
MSAIVEKEFDRNFKPRERHRGYPRLALRQRSQQHPMVLFFLVVITAFSAMTLVPPSGGGIATFSASGTSSMPSPGSASGSLAAAAGPSRSDAACHGQAWGAESPDCLATIAGGRKVRVIAGA